jgi:hypothetical protein
MLRRMRNAILRLASHGDALPNDCSVQDAPSAQNVINQFDNWISAAPPGAQFSTGGSSPLFNDGRVEWGIESLGGVEGLDILELGPFEAGHTYMLHKAGARSVLGIEAMSQSYFKCLAMKEVLQLDNVRFLLGDFEAWFRQSAQSFDAIWASGVLYHSMQPIELLKMISAHTRRLFIWTHYYPDDFEPNGFPVVDVETVESFGRRIKLFERTYAGAQTTGGFCGGTRSHTRWMRRGDILFVLDALGFNRVMVGPEYNNIHGQSFCVVAERR